MYAYARYTFTVNSIYCISKSEEICLYLFRIDLAHSIVAIVPFNDKIRRPQNVDSFAVMINVTKDNPQKVQQWYLPLQQKCLSSKRETSWQLRSHCEIITLYHHPMHAPALERTTAAFLLLY